MPRLSLPANTRRSCARSGFASFAGPPPMTLAAMALMLAALSLSRTSRLQSGELRVAAAPATSDRGTSLTRMSSTSLPPCPTSWIRSRSGSTQKQKKRSGVSDANVTGSSGSSSSGPAGKTTAGRGRSAPVAPEKNRKIALAIPVLPHKVPRCLKLKPITMTNYAAAVGESNGVDLNV